MNRHASDISEILKGAKNIQKLSHHKKLLEIIVELYADQCSILKQKVEIFDKNFSNPKLNEAPKAKKPRVRREKKEKTDG